jgi:hypothetical protein
VKLTLNTTSDVNRGMFHNDIKARCKNCGREAPAVEFILDPYFGMMVCQKCFKDRRGKDIVSDIKKKANGDLVVTEKKQGPPKPPGWDEEDEYLEKMARMKQQTTVPVKMVGEDKVLYKCKKCSYEFKYDIIKKVPGRCPYCCADIEKMRIV